MSAERIAELERLLRREKEKIGQLQEMFRHALDYDLERGAAWMNDKASNDFAKNYPKLLAAIDALMTISTEGDAA